MKVGLILKSILLLLGAVFVVTVIYLLVKRRINERNSFLWLAGALVIVLFSTMPEILEVIAVLAGVDYPPALLFLVSILVILFILLHQSIQISILQEKCRELSQLLAIINFQEKNRQTDEQIRGTGEFNGKAEVSG